MSKTAKWILGIGLGLLVVACLAAAGFMVMAHRVNSAWTMDSRSGWLWHDDSSTPWGNNPGDQDQGKMMPWGRLPRGRLPQAGLPGFAFPFFQMGGFHTGFFSPIRFIAAPLLCLGFLGVLILGGVAIGVNARKTKKTTTPDQPFPASETGPNPEPTTNAVGEPSAAASAVEIRTCGNCGREAQTEWEHCPYCGNTLA